MRNFVAKLLKDNSGATAIEYGLIAAVVSIVILSALQIVGTQLKAVFTTIGTTLQTAAG